MKPRISMITLGVEDLQASIVFYEKMGFSRKEPVSDEIAFFDLNGSWLGLYPWGKLAEDAQVPPDGAGFRGVTLAHNLASKEDVDALMDEAVAAGATMVKKPQEVFWGGYSGYFADPDGHLWEIAFNPFSWIGPAD
ncbi:MAG: VOC family protein [Kiritimatiellaeota bacterium]|nr:VOC family protein [Kiritimatiellota bacterium]